MMNFDQIRYLIINTYSYDQQIKDIIKIDTEFALIVGDDFHTMITTGVP